jgi:undecaprenyl pyrophosphate phosphatase UppP
VTLAQALFMGLLQGATELFPVSSLGHSVIIPSLLHWAFKQSDPTFVPFLVLLHLGTAGSHQVTVCEPICRRRLSDRQRFSPARV